MTKVAIVDYMNEELHQAMLACTKDGLYNPQLMIEHAKDPESPLHPHFTWDAEKGMQTLHLVEARALIRTVKFHVMKAAAAQGGRVTITTVRAAVSLPSQRRAGGGYHSIVDVLANQDQREEMLADAKRELARVRQKYAALSELAELWQQIDMLDSQGDTPLLE